MFKALYQSFYSKALYIDVAQNWKGLGFGFLFALVALYCVPYTVAHYHAYKAFLENDAPFYLDQIPAITIKDGRLSIDRELPYSIVDRNKRAFIIFDRARDPNTLYRDQALVTETHTYLRRFSGEIWSMPHSWLSDQTFTKATAEEWTGNFKKWFLPLFFTSALIGVFIFRSLQVLLYGVIGLQLNRMVRSFLGYRQIVRLSILAITPVLVIDAVLMMAKGMPVSWGFLGFLVAMGYLLFGLRANRGLLE